MFSFLFGGVALQFFSKDMFASKLVAPLVRHSGVRLRGSVAAIFSLNSAGIRPVLPMPSLYARAHSDLPYYPPRIEDMLDSSEFEDIKVIRRRKKLAKLRRRGKGPPKKGSGKRSKRK